MRIYLTLSPNQDIVPYTYQQILVSKFHSLLGENLIHDQLSLYSFSWLSGGKGTRAGLTFRNGATWFISSPNIELIKQLIQGIQNNPELAFGMVITEISIFDTPSFPEQIRFETASPVFVKREIDGKAIHFSFDDKKVDEFLTQTMISKMKLAGFQNTDISVGFDRNYKKAKTKLVTYKGIKNKANYCPVIISGSPDAIAFAWDVGVGNCTGIGFGSIQ